MIVHLWDGSEVRVLCSAEEFEKLIRGAKPQTLIRFFDERRQYIYIRVEAIVAVRSP